MAPLLESEAPEDPFVLFNRWFRDAAEAGALQPDAVTLATASRTGAPSARMVLFKGLEGGAFVFYSNYGSRKGRELAQNNRAAMVFFWSIKRHQCEGSRARLRPSISTAGRAERSCLRWRRGRAAWSPRATCSRKQCWRWPGDTRMRCLCRAIGAATR